MGRVSNPHLRKVSRMTDDAVPGRIVVSGLGKTFGDFVAVKNLSFTVEPGRITGFLGPNGAGKTTTLRMLLGLIHPTQGTATIGGVPYVHLAHPTQTVGASLEANFHPGRTGRNHLRVLAAAGGIPDSRVDEMLQLVGIPAAANKAAGGYSLGMRQRLGLAGAMLGDPQVLVLDEPANGLDPEGIRWLRKFLRHLAEEGRTILVSSHLLSEVEHTVDDVVIIANGKAVRSGPMAEIKGEPRVLVRTPGAAALQDVLTARGLSVTTDDDGALHVLTSDLALVGDAALAAGVPVHELRGEQADLEALFFELTETPENANRNLGAAS